MPFYFLPDDFKLLNHKISSLAETFKEIGQDMGKSCQETSETFHDNFGYEDGARQQRMLSGRLQEMVQIRNNARVVKPPPSGCRVGIGREVEVMDEIRGERRTFKVGSYMVFCNKDTYSYAAPLVRLLIGAKEGDVREGKVNGRLRCFEVLRVA